MIGARRNAIASLSLAIALGFTGRAAAQYLAPNAPPQFGVLQVRDGFAPDPMVADGNGGGRVSLQSVHPSCRGYASEAPSHVIMARSGIRFLAIMVQAGYDSTLLVQTPDGQIYCNDDTDGRQPRVEISAGPGPIRVWVGSYSSSNGGPYRLGLSNSTSVRSAQLGMPGTGVVAAPPGPPPGVGSLFGETQLRAGFLPDPALLTGTSGGPIDATSMDSSCRGWITPQPSHIVMAQTGFRYLRFVVSASHDTTLVVQYPNGQIACNDDGGGSLNPLIEGPTGPGPIRVWVGSYSSGSRGPYTIGVTENPSVTYGMLGGGVGSVVVQPPPPPPPPPPIQPPSESLRVDLLPRIPVTLFGPGMTTATLGIWSPRGGPRIELRVTPVGNSLQVSAGVGSSQISLVTVPADLARDALVTVTQRPDHSLLVRAERAPGATDPGAQMLLLVRWNGRTSVPDVAEQWVGTFRDRAPRWGR